MDLIPVEVITDGGPWAKHNMPCPVYHDIHAILVLNTGVFYPSHKAQREGWMLVKVRWGWAKRVIRWLCEAEYLASRGE